MSFKLLDFLLIVKEKGLDSAKSHLEDRIETKLNKNQKQQLNDKINNINKVFNKKLKLKSAEKSAVQNGQHELAQSIKQLLNQMNGTGQSMQAEPTKMSPSEGLAFLLKNNFTKAQYDNIRATCLRQNANIFPCYDLIQDAKAACRPEEIVCDGISAKVPLNNLIRHTIKRLVESDEEAFVSYFPADHFSRVELTMHFSWGFDGSTGQSQYHQKAQNENETSQKFTDASLFVTVLNPLRLCSAENPKQIFWNNDSPQSTSFIRPLRMERTKETKDHVLKTKREIEEEHEKMKKFDLKLSNGIVLIIHILLHLTLIDGKIASFLTNTASQNCPVCGNTPTEMTKVENLYNGKFNPRQGSLKYGIRTLHSWIRALEFLLHLAYRLNVGKWQVKGEKNRETYNKTKYRIHEDLKNKIGVNVDQPRAGGAGTSNTGNAARRCFEDPDKFAEILKIDQRLVRNLKAILIALSITQPIDIEKYNELCKETFLIHVSLYPWFFLPSSIHCILIHSKDVMINSSLPNGMLGEEGPESCNKLYKYYRDKHARKTSWQANLIDVFNRRIDSSDPVIASTNLRYQKQKRTEKDLPEIVKQVLTHDEFGENSSRIDSDGSLEEFYEELDDIVLDSEHREDPENDSPLI